MDSWVKPSTSHQTLNPDHVGNYSGLHIPPLREPRSPAPLLLRCSAGRRCPGRRGHLAWALGIKIRFRAFGIRIRFRASGRGGEGRERSGLTWECSIEGWRVWLLERAQGASPQMSKYLSMVFLCSPDFRSYNRCYPAPRLIITLSPKH